MFNRVISAAVNGIESKCVLVEADVSDGLPMFSMVGYLASEVREAQDRVRTALRNSGYALPPKHITVNLAPVSYTHLDVYKRQGYYPVVRGQIALTLPMTDENITGFIERR